MKTHVEILWPCFRALGGIKEKVLHTWASLIGCKHSN